MRLHANKLNHLNIPYMDSKLKQEIINQFRLGKTFAELGEEFGFTELAMRRLLIPRPVSKITTAVVSTRIMDPDEQKKAIQKRAGRRAAETRKANKLKAAATGAPPPTKKSKRVGAHTQDKVEAKVIPIETAVVSSPVVEQEQAKVTQQQVPEAMMVLAELCNNIMRLGELLLIKK